MEKTIRLAIRELVEFVLRSGDIDSRYTPRDRMYEGARIHRVLQKRSSEAHQDYRAEVKLSAGFVSGEFTYILEGRADGVFTAGGMTVIDEIKTTTRPLNLIDDSNETHWAQAKCYAHIYAMQNALPEIAVRLTYCNTDTVETKSYEKSFRLQELEAFMESLLGSYSAWARHKIGWQALRDASIKAMPFPFPAYRKGQRELAVSVYRTIEAGRKLFAQAPTGTGKTISALFPAVKAMGEGRTSKVFYLTAKTITRQVAEEAFDKMRVGGLRMKTLTLTAKEKICFCETAVCRPEVCPYAKGYFDRANGAVFDVITSCDHMSRSVVEEYARKHTVCPFELSLDISNWADCVICDYNYVFDPRTYLRRFFAENGGDYVFLVDEAHNLVERSREMFSAELDKTQFYEIKKQMKGVSRALDKTLTAINRYMIDCRKRCGEAGCFVEKEKPEALVDLIDGFISDCEFLLAKNGALGENSDFLQLYFNALNFALISEFYDERYVTYAEVKNGQVTLRLFCLDPSFLLGEAFRRGGAAALFSATLTPLDYFRDILGGTAEDRLLALDSPFDSRHLCLMAADRVSTRFRHREESADRVTQLLGTFVSKKTGNYIVYFPSYKYMKYVFTRFTEAYPQISALEQETALSEEDRERFLERFKEDPEKTLVAFCVLGGIFSEGIDLKGSRLIGSAIVSVGLPQLSARQNILKTYFDEKNGKGFEYAYMYPGMNKVLQAAGRVIRSEDDVGAVLLIDERFGQQSYMRLFPKHWQVCRLVRSAKSLEAVLDDFWKGHAASPPMRPAL